MRLKEIWRLLKKKIKIKLNFLFFDSKWNQNIQNEDIEKLLNRDFDLFVINPITTKKEEIQNSINKIVSLNLPFIIYLPTSLSLLEIGENAPRSAVITRDVEQSGTLQGKILVDVWNNNKNIMDRNKDNILQYVMLQGPPDYLSTVARTKYSIRALDEANIKTEQLLSTSCNWSREYARSTIESAFLVFGDKLEAIISNNDEMALGAIEALQKYGFNTGDKSKYIPVVGVNGLSEAKELVAKGIMTGTVIENIAAQAKAIYDVAINLVSGNNITHATNLKAVKNNVIKLPYYEYVNP